MGKASSTFTLQGATDLLILHIRSHGKALKHRRASATTTPGVS